MAENKENNETTENQELQEEVLTDEQRQEILDDIMDLDEVDDVRAERLFEAGIRKPEEVADLSQSKIAEICKCGKNVAKTIKEDAQEIVNAMDDENAGEQTDPVTDIDENGIAGQDDEDDVVKYVLHCSIAGFKPGQVVTEDELNETEKGLFARAEMYLEKVKG